MKTSDFDYLLPQDLIAQNPLERRDSSRLLLLDRGTGAVEHRRFYDLPEFLNAGDLVVFNTSKVFPARIFGKRKSGAQVEVLILTIDNDGTCTAIVRHGRKLSPGETISFEGGAIEMRFVGRSGEVFKFQPLSERPFLDVLLEIGHVPLPPYIERADTEADKTRYQTVYADMVGAVAAPTAGLHFTPEILEKIDATGADRCEVVLHVGYGTFKPLKTEDLGQIKLHSERFEVSAAALEKISRALEQGRRIVAVGTTTCRLLESLGLFLDGSCHTRESGYPEKEGKNWIPASAGMTERGCPELKIMLKDAIASSMKDGVAERKNVKVRLNPGGGISGETGIFIHPGFEFKLTGALVTNFHLPKSSLLMLVSAFAGTEKILSAYRDAVERKYRFYSYGDAMFIR